jgi:hypothetical protein
MHTKLARAIGLLKNFHFRPLLLALAFCAYAGAAEAQNVTLTITNDGPNSGAVGVQPGGNVCNPNPGGSGGGTCIFTYTAGTHLRISANSPSPSPPGIFNSGVGDTASCATSTCEFTLNGDSSITATFNAGGGPFTSLTIGLLGDGKGNVGTDNNQCQNFELGFTACTTLYGAGSVVLLQGRSMPGNIFAGFSDGAGDTSCTGTGNCSFTLSNNSSLNASFSAMASVAIAPSVKTINVGNGAFFNATPTFTNGMTRPSFNGNTPWQSHVPMDIARFSLAVVAVNDRLYAIGGVDGSCAGPCAFGPLNTVERFNPLVTAFAEFEQAWTGRAPMTTPREGLAATVVDGKIYAIGGHTTGGGAVASMEFYDPLTNTWSARASMSGPRANMAAVTIDNTIYVVGGSPSFGGDPDIPLATVEAYDATTNTWTAKAPMLTSRTSPAAAAVNGTLYVIGGDGTGSVEAYDAVANSWSMKASMPDGGGSHEAAALNGLIYAVGGSPITVKVYNPALDAWMTLTPGSPLPVNNQFALAAFDGRLFAAGGMLADNSAVRTLSANRPPEATWWSSNPAVGRINSGNSGSVQGLSAGTATISARLVGIDSGAQSALLTVNPAGGGPGQIFLGIPNQGFTQVGDPNWGCGTFNQNNANGPYSATINYGEGGGVENLPLMLNPPAGTCSSPGSINKGAFFFNHAYASAGTFHVTLTVTNTSTNQSATGGFDVQVQDNGGGGGDEDCAQVITNFTVIGSLPFDMFHVKFFDRATNELLFETDAPFVLPEDAAVPAGQYRIELSVPEGYMITPSSFSVDAVCGTPIHLDATIQAIPVVPPTISLSLSPDVIWPPNNQMVAVSATIVASSPDGHATTVELVSVTSSVASAGDIAGASLGTDDRAFEVRAKKDRTYTVTYRATDSVTGLSATATATVVVPHDQGK